MLIVISLMISIAGTWIVSDRLDIDRVETKEVRGTQEGKVGFTLVETPSKTGESTGNIGFTKIK
ncbi:hypothetical protein KY361_04090 [Candidatus Woesearchaeota archaeon]|nr:hypothetical protein [Candidatus Woesearchaeota archaeon]